ncbi:MAG: hypothetical protein ABGW78_05165 [Pirellulales bacterium]
MSNASYGQTARTVVDLLVMDLLVVDTVVVVLMKLEISEDESVHWINRLQGV